MVPTGSWESLRTVSSSNVQLQHSEARQSIAASEDYAFSEHATNHKTDGSRTADSNSRLKSRTPSPSIPRKRSVPGMTNDLMQGNPCRAQRPEKVPIPVPLSWDRHSQPVSRKYDGNSWHPPSRAGSRSSLTPGVDDSPYIRFAIDQLTRDEEVSGMGRQGSVACDDYPVERLVWDEGLGYFTSSTIRSQDQSKKAPPPPERQAQTSVDPECFVAARPAEDSLSYPPVNSVPTVLQPLALGSIILCCLLMIAGVVFCNIWSQHNHGLWNYAGVGDTRYFVMQFLPQILAAVLTFWTFVIQAAVARTMPFAMMSSSHPGDGALRLPLLSRNFVFPDLSQFSRGEVLVGFTLCVIWMSNLLAIPFLGCLFQAKHYIIHGHGIWRWASVQAVGWVLVALYGLLVIALILLMSRFNRCTTGLMWDPISLADLIPIIQRSNILHDFEGSEVAPNVAENIPARELRLGYWQLSNHPETFYGIGEEHAPMRNPSLLQSRSQRGALSKVNFDAEQLDTFAENSLDRHLYSPFTRYRWMVWFLRDALVFGWIMTLIVLFVAFVLVSFIHDAVQGGFPPRLPTLPTTGAFSSSNFVYSFIPALIGNILFLAWQPVDVYFRALQPFADLSSPEGSVAEKSILLAYPSCLPFEVSVLAFVNRHYKVALISFMSVASAAIPILAGGVFIALWYNSEGEIRITPCMPAFYALVVFCALYTVSSVFLWPSRRRYLPHDITTLADLISYLYQSPLLSDKLLREPRCKADLVTRLVIAPPGEREKSLYGFGIYVGRDGKEHLGIDRFRRPGRTDMLITTG